MAQEPYKKGTICSVKGTTKEVKILAHVKADGKKQKGFIYEVEPLFKADKDEKNKFSSIEIQAKSMGFGK